jgi:UDP-N-acetylglucosamine 4,6-dehydratase
MRTVLVIGGTGSLGTALLPLLLKDPEIDRIRVMSRGEHKQSELARKYLGERIEWFVGDVRDWFRVEEVVNGCSDVFHLAAYKSVDTAEKNQLEAIKTNVDGTHNVIQGCLSAGVGRAMFISTDKAVEAVTQYGKTKAVAESLFIEGNLKGSTRFSVCRYGNVFGSNGSVLQLWLDGRHTVTDEKMTRFFITRNQAAEFVYKAWKKMEGGETFIPPMKSTTIADLLFAVTGKNEYEAIGRRAGEKEHEVLISEDEAEFTTDSEWCFVRWPLSNEHRMKRYGHPMSRNYSLTSENAQRFTQPELVEMVKEWRRENGLRGS